MIGSLLAMFVELELFIEYRAKSGVLMEGNGLLNGVIQTVVSSDDSLRSWFFISLQISLGMASGLLLTSRTERCNDKKLLHLLHAWLSIYSLLRQALYTVMKYHHISTHLKKYILCRQNAVSEIFIPL